MIRDSGVSGNGSYFGARFKAGDVISASQLNDLNSGLMVGTVQPYLGAGATVAYGAGGTQVIQNTDLIYDGASYSPFQVIIQKQGTNYVAKIVQGWVVSPNLINATVDAPSSDTLSFNGIANFAYYAQQTALYPSGSYLAGSDTSSIFMNQGGGIIMPTTTQPVYFCLVRNLFKPDNGTALPTDYSQGWPYVGVFVNGDAGDTNSYPYAGNDEQQYYSIIYQYPSLITVYDPPFFEPIISTYTVNNMPTQIAEMHLWNYNWSRLIFAKALWNGTDWVVTQFNSGHLTFPLNFAYNKQAKVLDGTASPPFVRSPDNVDGQNTWYDNWTGTDKSFTNATVMTPS